MLLINLNTMYNIHVFDVCVGLCYYQLNGIVNYIVTMK